MASATTELHQDRLEHMIIWLDFYIGQFGDYQHLKEAFASSTDPTNEIPVTIDDRDFSSFIVQKYPMPLLALFTDVEGCIECFERNQDKRIFFITSGSLGKVAVPQILERFRHTFTDPVTNEPYVSIYVLCCNTNKEMDWAFEYHDYIQIFNFDADLLSRMVRDIAEYYFTRSKRLLAEDPPNNLAAYHRLNWAYELYQRYSRMGHFAMSNELNEIDRLRQHGEEELKSLSDEDDPIESINLI
jgi:hypothetical protein